MFSNTLSSWFGSVEGYNSRFMSVDKFLGIGEPMKEIEKEEYGRLFSTSTESNRNYYHELYKQALKCIESAPTAPSVSPRSNYGSPSGANPCHPAPRLSPPLVNCEPTPKKMSTSPHSVGIHPAFPKAYNHCAGDLCAHSKGPCGLSMLDHNCEECKTHDIIAQRNLVMHQKAMFSTEFLMRQKEKWRRPRTVYTEKQLVSLEKAYKSNKYLRGKERKELCKVLNLEERHIKVWYQNRRAKERGQIRHDKWLKKARKYSKKNGISK